MIAGNLPRNNRSAYLSVSAPGAFEFTLMTESLTRNCVGKFARASRPFPWEFRAASTPLPPIEARRHCSLYRPAGAYRSLQAPQ